MALAVCVVCVQLHGLQHANNMRGIVAMCLHHAYIMRGIVATCLHHAYNMRGLRGGYNTCVGLQHLRGATTPAWGLQHLREAARGYTCVRRLRHLRGPA